MNKTKKLLSLLVLGLMVTGCDVEALPSDYEDTVGAIKLEEVYDTIRNGQGEAAIYNKFINLVAEKEIKAANRWAELCDRVQEKVDDMIEDQYTDVNYNNYTITAAKEDYTTVNDAKLNAYYLSQGYKISSPDNNVAHDSNVWKASEVLKDGSTYVNTYISESLKNEVLSSMLNEQFIFDRKANSLYKTKQIRQIEYVYVDFNTEAEDESIEFVYNINDELIAGTRTDLESVETDWKKAKKEVILANAQKAGDPVLDEDGKYYNEFTSCGNSSVKNCANEKMYAVDEAEYYSEPQLYTKADSPLLSSMTDVLFSSTLKYDDEAIKEVKGSDGKTYYYLKAQSNVELGAESLINVDAASNKYYFVRFVIVDNKNPEDADYSNITPKYENQEAKYAIAQTLATESSNYSNCILYYLNKYNLSINDDKFFEYVFDTYGYPEEEE